MRLSPLTIDVPKPVIPIANKTLLETQIQLLKAAGIRDIILSLNYQPAVVKETIGDGSNFGVRLNYLVEPDPRGTAGAYKFAEKFIDSTTIILNGDILTDLDLQPVINQHKNLNSLATIVLTEIENPSAYGLVETDVNNKVLNFLEKPNISDSQKLKNKTINAGIYILESGVLNYIPEKEKCSFEYHLFPTLIRQKENFHAYIMQNNYWLDIGTPKHYLQAHYDLINGKVKNFQINRNHKLEVCKEAEIDNKSIIAEDCRIAPGAKIINSVLGKNVSVGEKTVIENSVIWSGTQIGSQICILDSIIGSNCCIGEKASPDKGAVLGSNTILI